MFKYSLAVRISEDRIKEFEQVLPKNFKSVRLGEKSYLYFFPALKTGDIVDISLRASRLADSWEFSNLEKEIG